MIGGMAVGAEVGKGKEGDVRNSKGNGLFES